VDLQNLFIVKAGASKQVRFGKEQPHYLYQNFEHRLAITLFAGKSCSAMLLVIDTAHQQLPVQHITCIIFDSTTSNPPL